MGIVRKAGCSASSCLLSSLELSDTKVYAPKIRALLGTAAHFCEVVSRRGIDLNDSARLGGVSGGVECLEIEERHPDLTS